MLAAAAASLAEPDPLTFTFTSLVRPIERARSEVVSAVLEVAVPVSRVAELPMRLLLLLLQPTSATKTAVMNKLFFISSFLLFAEKEPPKTGPIERRLLQT